MNEFNILSAIIADIEERALATHSKTEKCKYIDALSVLAERSFKYNMTLSAKCEEACDMIISEWKI